MILPDFSFPPVDALSQGFWQPIFFIPNLDTPERLVAAVITCVDGKWVLTKATALDRLRCLYGQEAEIALEAVNFGLKEIESTLSSLSPSDKVSSPITGLELGDRMPAQGHDSAELGFRKLRLISSLHNRRKEYSSVALQPVAAALPADPLARDIERDRLSVLVMEHMAESAPQSRVMFNSHVRRLERDQGARLLTHKAYVAYDGKNVAANFATLKPGRHKVGVDISKRLMWDLEQHRESDRGFLNKYSHEMILYHPSRDDPTITPRQFDNVMEVVDTLQQEGQSRDIKVMSYISVPEISDHILQVEGLRLQ